MAKGPRDLARRLELQKDIERTRARRRGWEKDLSGEAGAGAAAGGGSGEQRHGLVAREGATMDAVVPTRAQTWGNDIVRGSKSQLRQPNLPGSRSIDTVSRIMTSHVP
jgi:hypothetical protein